MCSTLCLDGKLVCRRTTFGSAASPAHTTATAMHFPANAGLIFLTDELTNDRYLVDTGAILSIIPCNQNSSPSGPLLNGADGQPIPSWCFIHNFKANFSHPVFYKPLWPVPYWALTKKKFKVIVAPEINQIQFACTAAALPAPICLQQPRPPCYICLAFHRLQLQFQSSCQLRRLLHSLLPYPHMKSGIPR